MTNEFVSSHGLSVSRGGSGEKLAVLLHGLGANRAVWSPMTAIADAHWPGRWIAPDFRGHGGSPMQGPWGYGAHAADIADLIKDEDAGSVTLVGHSFGGVIAALAGSGLFGPAVKDIAAFGVKIVWSAEDVAKARAFASASFASLRLSVVRATSTGSHSARRAQSSARSSGVGTSDVVRVFDAPPVAAFCRDNQRVNRLCALGPPGSSSRAPFTSSTRAIHPNRVAFLRRSRRRPLSPGRGAWPRVPRAAREARA